MSSIVARKSLAESLRFTGSGCSLKIHGLTKPSTRFELKLTDQREKTTGGTKQTVQAGLAFIDVSTVPGTARWNTEDFFVPPSLWGAGLGAKFLDKLLEVLQDKEKIQRCEVTVKPPPDEKKAPIPWTKRTDLASRQAA